MPEQMPERSIVPTAQCLGEGAWAGSLGVAHPSNGTAPRPSPRLAVQPRPSSTARCPPPRVRAPGTDGLAEVVQAFGDVPTPLEGRWFVWFGCCWWCLDDGSAGGWFGG